MSVSFFIARRYLRSRRNSGFISFITFFSVVGVTVGVAALIITLSILRGFERTIKENVVSFTANMQIFGFQSQVLKNPEEAIAKVMKDEGYIEDYKVLPEKPQAVLQITLKYTGDRRNHRSIITGLERVSRPGRRIYVGKNDVPWVLSGMGTAIVTTSKGVMTGQQARRLGVGGEVICKVW